MLSFLDDPSVERFVARRATGWRQQDSAVVLELEGVREPDPTGIAAILAGARLDGAVDRAELADLGARRSGPSGSRSAPRS